MRNQAVGAAARLGLTALLCLGAAGAGQAAGKVRTAVMHDFDEGGAGFRFSDGSFVKPGQDAELYQGMDLMFDLPHGLGTNNAEVWPFFRGKGGIVDVGPKALAAVKEAPAAGYVPGLKPDGIVQGHTYCVRTADGEHYAKLHVVKFDREKETLEFSWQYQPRPTTVFE